MLTALLLKGLYVALGAVAGWFGKKLHVNYGKWAAEIDQANPPKPPEPPKAA